MEVDEENPVRVHGSMLEGAIFMSNRKTRKECLKRKIFGLPPSQAKFVKEIKTGMILFLFEYEERKLYGVFEASSDGAMNISPYAFTSSGKSFSAQVRFQKIWSCHPLVEDEFYDAIQDNYYMPHKFHFYLSKEQVSNLLQLFSSRKIKYQQSPSLGTGKCVKWSKYSGLGRVRVTAKGRLVTSDDVEGELEPYDGVESVCLSRQHPDLSKHNQNHSAYYDNLIVNTEIVVDEDEQGFTFPVPCSTNLHTSDVIRSKSQRDGTVMINRSRSPPDDHPYHPLHLHHSFSSGMTQNSTSTRELIAQPNWHQNLDVSTNNQAYRGLHLSDSYEPSRKHMFSPGSGYFENKSIKSTNFEAAYKDIAFPKGYDLSRTTVSFSRAASSGKKILDSPSLVQSPAWVPIHMHDCMYPAASQPEDDREGRRDWYNESSATTVSFSKAENFGKQVMDSSYFLSGGSKDLSQFMQGEGKDLSDSLDDSLDYIPLTNDDDEYFPSSRTSSLHSEKHNKKTSVFSRLSTAPEPSLQEEENDDSDMGILMNELLEQLSRRRKCWRKATKKSKLLFPWNDEKHPESEPQVDTSGLITAVGDENDFWSNDEIAGERPKSPFVNFKRRSAVWKMKSETETSACAEGTKSEGSPVKRKRRKLIRPSLSKEESFGQGINECCDVKEPSQEIFGNKASITDGEHKGNGQCIDLSVKNVDCTNDAFNGDMTESSQDIYRSQASVIDAESRGICISSDLSVRNVDSKDAFDNEVKESSQEIDRNRVSVIDTESKGICESDDPSVRNVDNKDAFDDDLKEVWKMKSETETSACAEGTKSEGSPVKRKRRKLIRPSLSKEESFGQGISECCDVKEPSQEIFRNKASITDGEHKGNGQCIDLSVKNVDCTNDAFNGDMTESSQDIYRSQASVIDAESRGICISSDLSVRNVDSKDAFDNEVKKSSQEIDRNRVSVIDTESKGICESDDPSVRNVDNKDAFDDDLKESSQAINRNHISVIDAESKGICESDDPSVRNIDNKEAFDDGVKETSQEIDRSQVSVIDAERKGIGDSTKNSVRNQDFIPLEVNSPEGL